MKYSLLCSGSKGNCCVIEGQEGILVIDCGSTKRYLTQSFHNIGVDYTTVNGLLLTHDHSDHIAQLKLFANANIYAPFELKGLPQSYRVMPYQEFRIDEFSVLPIPLSHDTEINVGYIIENATEKLVYITDTGYIKETDFPLIRDADYYIVESNHDPKILMKTSRPYYLKQRILSDTGHMSNQASAEVLQQVISARTREIVLAHISEEANRPDVVLEVMSSALVRYLGQVSIRAAKQFEVLSGGVMDEKRE